MTAPNLAAGRQGRRPRRADSRPISQLTTAPVGAPLAGGGARPRSSDSDHAPGVGVTLPGSSPSLVGRHIDRYRIVQKLGQGGMGAVWKAKDERLDRMVAIKLLSEELALAPDARRRFLREARAASRLNHPGIAAVHDAGEVDGRLYLVTAYVEGCTLRERLRSGPLPIADSVRIASAVAEALQHAHEHGVIHRDISSGNVMVGRDGHATVIDLGLARLRKDASTRLTPSGATWGTVPYVAPEVIRDHDAGPRSDLYSLGVVLYEMLAGSRPFEAPAFAAMTHMILNEAPEPPSRRRPDVPEKLDRIVLKALHKEPARRYASAAAMARALQTLGPAATASDRRAAPRIPTISPASRPEAGAEARSAMFLAVLPFKDASPGKRRPARAQVFARGLAETVSARLAQVPGVHVIPPSALPAGRASSADLVALEREVGASMVLSGSVQRVGRKIRVGFSLVGPRRVQLAGDTLDGSMGEILDLEDQLVRRIARSLELEIASPSHSPEEGQPDPAAHERYLQALGYLQRYENEASVDGAIGLLEKLVASDPGDARAQATLGRAYLAKYLLTMETDWERRAAAVCRTALRLDSDLPEVLVTLGNLHRETGRYREALRDYRRALALRPGDPETLFELSWACEMAGKMGEAEEALQGAIAVRPGYWRLYNKLGVLYFNQARYEEAAKAWQRVIELTPDNARGHYNLAGAYYHLGRYEEAIAAYEESLRVRPDARAYTSLGTVFFYLGDRERAVRVFEKGRDLRPSDPQVWGNLADAYRWTSGLEGKAPPTFDKAIALKRQQLVINRKDGRGWVQLGLWLAKRGRLKEAQRAAARGLPLVPGDVNCMALAVRIHALAGENRFALDWLRKAIRHGYDLAELERDPELAGLRRDAEFGRIVKGRRAKPQGN